MPRARSTQGKVVVKARRKAQPKAIGKAKVMKTKAVPAVNRSSVLTQVMIGLTAVCVFAVLAVIDSSRFALLTGRAQVAENQEAIVEMQQQSAPKLSLLLARKGNEGYLKIWNDAADTVILSLPVEWQRLEVEGVPLSQVTSGKIELGYVPWSLPAHAGMTMLVSRAPDHIDFVNSASQPGAVTVKTVDLRTQSTARQVVLVKDKTTVNLWQAE